MTTGILCGHFERRDDFMRQPHDHWRQVSTTQVAMEHVGAMGVGPEEAALRASARAGCMSLIFSRFAPRGVPLEERLASIERLHEWLTRP